MTSAEELKEELLSRFAWRSDRPDSSRWADLTGWWRDGDVLAALGPALGASFRSETPTVVIAPQSRGYVLGALVAVSLGIGFVEVQKDPVPLTDSDPWWMRTTPPDYRDRHLTLGLPRRHLWLGAAVIVDASSDHRVRRQLDVRPLLHYRELRAL